MCTKQNLPAKYHFMPVKPWCHRTSLQSRQAPQEMDRSLIMFRSTASLVCETDPPKGKTTNPLCGSLLIISLLSCH